MPLSPYRTNLIANIAGTGSLALVQLACVPIYIAFLGIEAYGLVGFFMTLQAVLRVFDLGLSMTVNREMARYSVQPDKFDEMRDFLRTVETGYWLLGAAVGTIVAAPPR
jgi:O-antigen/teichoic acid export membrane protein